MYVSVSSFVILRHVLVLLLEVLFALHLHLLQLVEDACSNWLKMLLNLNQLCFCVWVRNEGLGSLLLLRRRFLPR